MPNQPNSNKCSCGKVKSSNLPAARLLHAKVWARNGGDPRAYFYQCSHRMWHWTSDLEQANYPKAA